MRYTFLLGFLLLIFTSLLSRVFYLAVQSNDYYEALSDKNTIKKELIAPIRGEILDRNLKPIAINKLGFKLEITPHLSRKSKFAILENTINEIHAMLPFLDAKKMLKKYKKADSHYNHNDIEVVDFISFEDVMPLYSKLNLHKYIHIKSTSKRFYPYGKKAAHVIGYVSKANQKDIDKDKVLKLIGSVGKNGIEKEYNSYLQGESGERTIKVSAFNKEIEQLKIVQPKENQTLVLNLDMRVQNYISSLFKDKAGVIIVMRANGEILAAGSYPEYNLNTFVSGISTKKWNALINNIDAPFTNKLINGLYPPGSTIKTGLGLIYASDSITPWWTSTCSGSMKLGNRKFRCWKTRGHGKTDLRKAIRESCDDYFYKGSLKTGIATMSEGMKRFGLGNQTGIDLPREFFGTVPSRLWKRQKYNQPWYIGETLNTSIGQGAFLVTPMQITRYTALMATGMLVTPHIAHKIGDKIVEPEYKDVLTQKEKENLIYVQQAMTDVANHPKGTASAHIHSKIKIAGKTGTAQVIGISQETKKRLKEHEMAYYTRSHAWFTSYGPVSRPEIIITALVEHGGHGGSAMGSVVSKIYDKLYELGYITRRK